jgi:predicted kinase
MTAAGLLAGCASPPPAQGSYSLDYGVASYDALKTATEKCRSEGGEIVLRSGYDNRQLANYRCKIGKGT